MSPKNNFLSRRDILKAGVAVSGTALFPWLGCAGKAVPETVPPDEGWLSARDPIARQLESSSLFSGDNPDAGHKFLRDAVLAPKGIKPSRSEKFVVIGGGVSGLACAYLHRDLRPVVLEQAPRFGGNSKGESWSGIDYTIGAAYLTETEDESPLMREFYAPLGIPAKWKAAKNDWVEVKGRLRKLDSKQFKRFEEFLHDTYDKKFPDIPRRADSAVSEKEFREWDGESFYTFLKKRILHAPPEPLLYSLIEHYCFAAFGGSSREISGAGGLNFMASEIKGTKALPGGNSCVASGLFRKTVEAVGANHFLAGTTVTSVRVEDSGVIVEYLDAEREMRALRADRAIVAAPKFIAHRIVQGLGEKQREMMEKVKYRSYVVGNACITGQFSKDFYDVYLLGDGRIRGDAERDANEQRATDAVASQWCYPQSPANSVLTLFRASPFDSGRARLLSQPNPEALRSEFRMQAEWLLRLVGKPDAKVTDVRVTRWGHPLPLCEIGLLSSGYAEMVTSPVSDRIFFCNQDDWLMPAIETSLHQALALRKRMSV